MAGRAAALNVLRDFYLSLMILKKALSLLVYETTAFLATPASVEVRHFNTEPCL